MRDYALLAFILGSIPMVFQRPWVGALLWAWISLMNPHRFTWGIAYDFPVAVVVGGATLLALVFRNKEVHAPKFSAVLAVWMLFLLWMCITLPFSFHPNAVMDMWGKVMKIMLMLFVTILLVHEKKHIEWLIWVVTLSIGLLGIKGGIFTLTSGGDFKVWGPAGSFIEGNNEMGLALIVVIPLAYYLHEQVHDRRVKWGLLAVMGASAISALGTQSRGAFLAIVAMATFLWLKSNRKLIVGLAIALAAPAMLIFMPDAWHARMDTINNYQEDGSAMGRINAWIMAYRLACDNFFGGGFQIYDGATFARYAPDPSDVHAAHSIYFQVLGEHGFVGLGLFILLGIMIWRLASRLIKATRDDADLAWITMFARMAQVSLAGFAVGGAFLSLAYFDLPYYLLVILSCMDRWLARERARQPAWHEAARRPMRPARPRPV